MIDPRLTQCVIFQKPYLGAALRALQGEPNRHVYMQALVELLARRNSSAYFKALEIGSWAGGSALTWAHAIKRFVGDGKVVCVDHWQPYFDIDTDAGDVYRAMNEAARDGLIYALFLHNIRTSGVASMISPIVGRSQEILPTLPRNDFTIVYLDAAHDFPSVQADIRLAADLVKEGGILCGDDLELQASQLDAGDLALDVESRRDYVKSRTHGIFYHPGVTRAVAEAFGEVSTWEGFWAMAKQDQGWEKVDLEGCTLSVPDYIVELQNEIAASENDRKRDVEMIGQIAEGIKKNLQPYQYAPEDVPELVATYHGYNIVRLGKYFYGVNHAVGEIDWSVPSAELAKRYGEINFLTADPSAIVEGAGLRELRGYIDTLSDAVAQSLLRQESALAKIEQRADDIAQASAASHSAVAELRVRADDIAQASAESYSAVGDLHARLDELESLIQRLKKDMTDVERNQAEMQSRLQQAQSDIESVKGNALLRLASYIFGSGRGKGHGER